MNEYLGVVHRPVFQKFQALVTLQQFCNPKRLLESDQLNLLV